MLGVGAGQKIDHQPQTLGIAAGHDQLRTAGQLHAPRPPSAATAPRGSRSALRRGTAWNQPFGRDVFSNDRTMEPRRLLDGRIRRPNAETSEISSSAAATLGICSQAQNETWDLQWKGIVEKKPIPFNLPLPSRMVLVALTVNLRLKDLAEDGMQYVLCFAEKGGKARLIPGAAQLQRYYRSMLLRPS